jgi:osmotically inducible protein OsmC
LKTAAKVPGIGADQFQEIANGAKTNCPVSKVLNCTITLDAVLI